MVNCGTIQVVEPFSPQRVAVPSDGCQITSNQSDFQPGGTITVRVTVSNQNPSAAAARVLLYTDNARLAEQTGQVPAGGTSTVSFEASLPSQPGEYTIQSAVVEASEL